MQLLIISLLILSNLLSHKYLNNDKPSNTYFENPLIDWDIINAEEKAASELNEDPLIEFQLNSEPAKKQSYEDLLRVISTLDDRFSDLEVRMLRLQESIEQQPHTSEPIDSVSKEQEEKQNNKYSEDTIITHLLCLFIFLLGALSISVYKNIKLLKKNKEYTRAEEERQSVETQTEFHRLDQSEDEISGVSDYSSSLESYSDFEENQKGKKKKRFGFNVRKCFWRCSKLKKKKNKEKEKTLDETSDESEESDESITEPTREKRKRGRNFLICCKKSKTFDSEDEEDEGKGKKKRFGLKIGKYFYRFKQAKKFRKAKHKKRFWQCGRQREEEEETLYETSEESEKSIDEVASVISESSDETYSTSSEITIETLYETAESDISSYVQRRRKIKRCTLTILLCCKKRNSLDSENKQDETSYETAESDQSSSATPREKIKRCSLNILLCCKKRNSLDSDDTDDETSSYKSIESDESIYEPAREKKQHRRFNVLCFKKKQGLHKKANANKAKKKSLRNKLGKYFHLRSFKTRLKKARKKKRKLRGFICC
ncbi:uncharacterized protein LOC121397566 [Xenopus laevis]|uniref:Uncharacterized protein LOC121397566 n=1 Tax=Xenopus laevis TaxID=8355 RepID=A0A8J1LMK7_XENLA|nr:uncharacterized protein LOC121397566 [Xenopus laevis]